MLFLATGITQNLKAAISNGIIVGNFMLFKPFKEVIKIMSCLSEQNYNLSSAINEDTGLASY